MHVGARRAYHRFGVGAIRRLLTPLVLVLTLLVAFPAVLAASQAQQSMSPEQKIAHLVNQTRLAHGLNPVAVNAELTAAAVAHTKDMIAKGYMEHEALDGSTPQARAIRHGYNVPPRSPWIVVEVISARATPEAAMNFLLSDRLHRGVMLRPTWREMGIAYLQGGPYGQFWTIEFGCRPNIIPVMAEASSGGIALTLTNEECAPTGGTAEQMGRANEMMISDRSDFDGAAWEPYKANKTVSASGGKVYVRLKDARGRESMSIANTPVIGSPFAAFSTPVAQIPVLSLAPTASPVPPTPTPTAVPPTQTPAPTVALTPTSEPTNVETLPNNRAATDIDSSDTGPTNQASPTSTPGQKPIVDPRSPGLFQPTPSGQ